MSTTQQHRPGAERIWIVQPGGRSNCYSDPEGHFAIVASGNREVRTYLRKDPYSLAKAFVAGEIKVRGDLFAAIRHVVDRPHLDFRSRFLSLAAGIQRLSSHFQGGKNHALINIHFHYDRSDEFYAQFLDSRMLYSAAYFDDPADSLEKAQTQKLEKICKDLVLRPGERFLDVGCGWGALICYAGEQFGAKSLGCTLSKEQFAFARKTVERRRLEHQVAADFRDFSEIEGRFDKVASVGMFEHVGRRRLAEYFRKMHSILEPGGLFLNRGIVRPRATHDGPDTLFVQKHVFPGAELLYLDEIVREAESAGFEVAGLRDLRTHYALTCRRWVGKPSMECRQVLCSGWRGVLQNLAALSGRIGGQLRGRGAGRFADLVLEAAQRRVRRQAAVPSLGRELRLEPAATSFRPPFADSANSEHDHSPANLLATNHRRHRHPTTLVAIP